MKKSDLKNLRTKSLKELRKMLSEIKIQLLGIYTKTKGGKEKNLKLAKGKRLEIAQIATIIREEEIMESRS